MDNIIIYEDPTIIITHKPPNLPTETSRLGTPDLVSQLKLHRKQNGEPTYLATIHRLDQPVEGLLVFAKTKAAAANLSAQLTKGTLSKSYTALVDGALPIGKPQQLTDYLLKDTKANTSAVVDKTTKGAKEAILTYTCLSTHTTPDNTPYSIVEIHLTTGRHHQIRVQMSHAGYPLLGDIKYGNPHSELLSKQLKISETALLADKICLVHPDTGKKMNFQIKYVEKWKFLEKSNT
jgi:23S rRNA pseudouridine1911/1915/1917 synthase